MSIEEMTKMIVEFRDARNWKQYHNPKDLAISISLEAAELLEVFQWSGSDLCQNDKKGKIEEELADVFIYSILMANECNLNIFEIVQRKIRQNDEKYPVDKAYGSKLKYTDLEG